MKKILFYLIFILANLIFFEFILSFFDKEQVIVKSFDKKLLFAMYPNKKGVVVSDEYSVPVSTNRLGFRQSLKPGETYKNIILGDSFTEGWGVFEEQTFVSLMNQSLNKEEKYLNLGVHGSSPLLFALQMPHFIELFRPKKIMIQLFDNDLDDNEKIEPFIEMSENQIIPKPRIMATIFGETIYNFFKETTLYRLTQRVYKTVRKVPAPILYYKPGKEPNLKQLSHEEAIKKYGELEPLGMDINKKYNNQFGFYKDENSKWDRLLKFQKSLLRKLVEQAKMQGAEIQFLYIPAREYFASGGILGTLKNNSIEEFHKNNPHYQLIKAVCEEYSLNCLYASDFLFDKNPEELYFPHDAHLNSKGHKILSEEIIKRIKK